MKSINCFVALCIALSSTGVVEANNTNAKVDYKKLKGVPHAFAGPKLSTPMVKSGNFRDSRVNDLRVGADSEPITGGVWGILQGPDGTEWIYTQSSEFENWDMTSSTITVFDSNNNQVGEFTVNIPEGQAVNDVQAFGQITNDFFDDDASTNEVMVYINEVIDYTIHGRIEVYSLDGTLKDSFQATSALYLDASQGWDTYNRFIMSNEVIEEDGLSYTYIDIVSPVSYQSPEAVSEHQFKIQTDLLYYSDGPYVNTYVLDGEPYFVISHYEKPYVSGTDPDTWEIIVAEDNNYVVEVYNQDFECVSTVKIPVEMQPGALYTMYSMGMFSYEDMTKGTYSGDDQFNFIITRYDYLTTSDSYAYDSIVYNEAGELVKTIGSEVTTWQKLASLPGEPEQVALVRAGGTSEEIEMVDLPSCETVAIFAGYDAQGNLLSTSLDRYPVGDTYQYVIALGTGTTDEEGNVITRIGWYNKDASLDHYVSINLGPNGMYADHYITASTLDPYLFNTDDQHEYILIARIANGDGYNEPVLMVVNDEGEVLKEYRGDETKGDYFNGNVMDINTNNPRLLVVYYSFETDVHTIETYALPFSRFTGGTGTPEDPYIISTAGDLDQVRADGTAHYALGNDIDMSQMLGYFDPIAEFSGTIDGRGYSINNLKVNSGDSMYAAMIEYMYGSTSSIKDLTFNRPVIEATSSCSDAGVVVGMLTEGKIDSVYVNNAEIIGDVDFSGEAGGIAGSAMVFATIASSAANNISINAPGGMSIGGIVGTTRTSTTVSACVANGTIIGGNALGGIVGAAGNDVNVLNCHADMDIEGNYEIGGIAGTADRGLISNCYSEGSLKAISSDFSGYCNVGGIVGYLSSEWDETITDPVISNCVAAIDAIELPEGALTQTVGRVVGRTIADEYYYEGEEPRTEKGLSNNYAVSTLTIAGEAVSSTDAASINGADVAADGLTTEFFTNLGWAFGADFTSPWKESAGLPLLYFEEKATNLTLDMTTGEGTVSNLFVLTATVEGTSAERVVFSSSDEAIAKVVSVEVDGNKAIATVRCYEEGSVTITASIDGLEAECMLNVSGVSDVIGDNAFAIYFDGQVVKAENATNIVVYNIGGAQVASAQSDYVEVGNLADGVYIVLAVDGNGNKAVTKIIKR